MGHALVMAATGTIVTLGSPPFGNAPQRIIPFSKGERVRGQLEQDDVQRTIVAMQDNVDAATLRARSSPFAGDCHYILSVPLVANTAKLVSHLLAGIPRTLFLSPSAFAMFRVVSADKNQVSVMASANCNVDLFFLLVG